MPRRLPAAAASADYFAGSTQGSLFPLRPKSQTIQLRGIPMWRLFSRAAAMVCAAILFSGVINLNIAYAGQKLSGPFTHENLSVYFIHGESAKGPVPLTLDEALARGKARLLETGNVQALSIENLGDEEVFIQAGDIVKGGRQDRVLSVSMLLTPRSGAVPISSYCVEAGRWAARGREDATRFSSASSSMPTREGKLAMRAETLRRAEAEDGPNPLSRPLSGRASGQGEVWREVAEAQARWSEILGEPVAAAESESSLQLSLENEKLKKVQAEYVSALKPKGEAGEDVVGYAVAVNGRIKSAEIYSSNGLFRKMWNKQLEAGAVEAVGWRDLPKVEAPKLDDVTAFLSDADRGKASTETLNADTQIQVRRAPQAAVFEAQLTRGRTSASVVSERRYYHRSYLKKD
jgi:hypothetical protein